VVLQVDRAGDAARLVRIDAAVLRRTQNAVALWTTTPLWSTVPRPASRVRLMPRIEAP